MPTSKERVARYRRSQGRRIKKRVAARSRSRSRSSQSPSRSPSPPPKPPRPVDDYLTFPYNGTGFSTDGDPILFPMNKPNPRSAYQQRRSSAEYRPPPTPRHPYTELKIKEPIRVSHIGAANIPDKANAYLDYNEPLEYVNVFEDAWRYYDLRYLHIDNKLVRYAAEKFEHNKPNMQSLYRALLSFINDYQEQELSDKDAKHLVDDILAGGDMKTASQNYLAEINSLPEIRRTIINFKKGLVKLSPEDARRLFKLFVDYEELVTNALDVVQKINGGLDASSVIEMYERLGVYGVKALPDGSPAMNAFGDDVYELFGA